VTQPTKRFGSSAAQAPAAHGGLDLPVLALLLALAGVAGCAPGTSDSTVRATARSDGAAAPDVPPKSYDGFVSARDYGSLEEAIASEQKLWLPAGEYVVDNPLVIRRDTPLYLHAGDQSHTRIIGIDATKPLIVIETAPHVSLVGLMLVPAKLPAPDALALVARNASPTTIELQDCRVKQGGLAFLGPGRIQIQNCPMRPGGMVRNAILVDHPDALVDILGGDISNGGDAPRVPTEEAYHVRSKRGRLRIYSMSVEATIGPADFRIDSASRHGPHVLTAVRSEGNNGGNKGSYRYEMLQVPDTDEKVDLILKSNIGAWGSGGYGKALFLGYNARGTVWMLGNNVQKGAAHLAEGIAPGATLVAIGNFVYDDVDPLPVAGARTISRSNIYFHSLRERTRAGDDPAARERSRRDLPLKRFVGFESPAGQAPPPIPDDVVPAPLPRLEVNRALPGMLDAGEYGAKGDGVADDTEPLQRALDAQCGRRVGGQIFFPAGTYRITKPLEYNSLSSCRHDTSGYLVGQGRERTRIVRDPRTSGGVFQTHSMAGVTIQGISFEAAPWRPDAPDPTTESAFALGGGPGAGPVSHFDAFYDVGFRGAKYGLGVRLVREGGNGEGNMIIDSEFRDSHIGLGIGSFNALNNNVFDSHFENLDQMIGHGEEGRAGGVWSVFGATGRRLREALMSFRAASDGAWYSERLDAEAPRILPTRTSGGYFPMLFDRSDLRPAPKGRLVLDLAQGGGVIFLHSKVAGLELSLRTRSRSMYAIRIGGAVDGWNGATSRGGHGRIVEIGE